LADERLDAGRHHPSKTIKDFFPPSSYFLFLFSSGGARLGCAVRFDHLSHCVSAALLLLDAVGHVAVMAKRWIDQIIDHPTAQSRRVQLLSFFPPFVSVWTKGLIHRLVCCRESQSTHHHGPVLMCVLSRPGIKQIEKIETKKRGGIEQFHHQDEW
jgi:hypothetical protein